MSNVALTATASTSFSTTSAYITASGTAAKINDDAFLLLDQYVINHSDTFLTNQTNTVTVTTQLDWVSEQTIKRVELYKSSTIKDSITEEAYRTGSAPNPEYPHDHTYRLYTWNGSTWDLQDTQSFEYSGEGYAKPLGYNSFNPFAQTTAYIKEGSWTTSKIKIETEISYFIEYSGASPNQDYWSFGVSEFTAYDDLADIRDVTLSTVPTETLTGDLENAGGAGLASPTNTTDGLTDTSKLILVPNTTSDVGVYDAIITFPQAYNLEKVEMLVQGEVFFFADAVYDWELQYFDTDWVSIATGQIPGIEYGNQYLISETGDFSGATKVRMIWSLLSGQDPATLGIFLFKAFSGQIVLTDIGLRIGSETIGAVETEESPLKIYANGTVYSLPLVDVGESDAAATRIYVNGEVKALRKI